MSYFDSLIVECDANTRSNLKQATMVLPSFRKVQPVISLGEALSRLSGLEYDRMDIVFVSLQFGWDKIRSFMSDAKASTHGEDCTYILVLKSSQHNEQTLAASILAGLHGFIVEPFSAENLGEVANIAAKVKRENIVKRQMKALRMLIPDVIKHIDAFNVFHSKGKNTSHITRRIEKSCSTIKTLHGDILDKYIDMAVESFSEVKPKVAAQYGGISKRVKRRMEQKALEEMEKEYEEEEERE